MPSELYLLHQSTLTKTVAGFQYPDFVLGNTLFPAQPIQGDTAEWDVLKPARKVGEFVADGAPSKAVALEAVGHRIAKCLKRFDSKRLSGDFLNNIRDLGARQKNARAALTREQQALDKRNAFAKEWALSRALTGTLTINQEDVKLSVDYELDGAHKPTASVSWATSTTDIPADLMAWKRLIEKDSGFTAGYAFANDKVLAYLLNNEATTGLLGESRLREQVAQSGVITNFMGLDWFFYNAGYLDGSGTFVPFIADDKVILTPKETDWCALQVGSTLIPSGNGAGNDLVEVSGRYSYAVVETDPPGVRLFVGDSWLPVIAIPGAVVYADVTP